MGDWPADGPRVAVVGTGLIGGSILLRLREWGADVTGWDPDGSIRALGRDRGLCFPDELTHAVRDRDVVFLCGPLPTLPEALLAVAGFVDEGCVLTDVGSTKGAVASFSAEHGLTGRFVPGHPMAGTERAGLSAADPALFEGAAWVLCPSADGIGRFRLLAGLLIEAFRARVVPMSVRTHDSVVAFSSHVPHLLAGSLAGAVARSPLRDAVLGLAAGSFRDGTRVAATPARRTADMLLNNRVQVLRRLAEVRAGLDELAGALAADDVDALVAGFERAGAARLSLGVRERDLIRREFPLTGPPTEEVAYLCRLGAAGGHLSGCRVDAATVTYAAYVPRDTRH